MSHPVKQIIRRVKSRTPESIEAEKAQREADANAALEGQQAAFEKAIHTLLANSKYTKRQSRNLRPDCDRLSTTKGGS